MQIRPKKHISAKTPWERFPLDVLPVSSITEQCYCEHRLHLWLKAPSSMVSVPRQLESPAFSLTQRKVADRGIAFHAQAAESSVPVAPVALRTLLRKESSLVQVESMFQSDFDGFPVVGIPDAVHFENGIARCVLDYKVTDSNQLQMGHRVQLLLYGWLLQESKIRVSDAIMLSVLVPNICADAFNAIPENERRQMAVTLHHRARATVELEPERVNWYIKKLPLSKEFWVRLRVFRYDRRVAKRELDFFTSYWKGKREALPTSNFRKCRLCLYNGIGTCKKAVVPFDGSM